MSNIGSFLPLQTTYFPEHPATLAHRPYRASVYMRPHRVAQPEGATNIVVHGIDFARKQMFEPIIFVNYHCARCRGELFGKG